MIETRTFVEEQRIGSLHDPASALTDVHGLAVSDDGELFVAQPQEGVVKVIDVTSGTIVRTIGRAGSGPGEFIGVGVLGLQGDTLWALDNAGALNYFTAAGEHLRTVRLPPLRTEAVSVPGSGIPTPEGRHLAVAHGSSGERDVPILVRCADGTVCDTAVVRRTERKGQARIDTGRGIAMVLLPFRDGAVMGIQPETAELALAVASKQYHTISLVRVTSTGDTILNTTLPYEPIPISPAHLDSIMARNPLLEQQNAEYRRGFREALERFTHFPPVTRVYPAADGVTWLRRERTGADSATWTSVRPDGSVWFDARLPSEADIRWASGEIIWAVIPDELDVPFLVRLRAR
ncbi:MAG: hypothetical protein WEF86_13800 [Gemmatimonadota bacterium]